MFSPVNFSPSGKKDTLNMISLSKKGYSAALWQLLVLCLYSFCWPFDGRYASAGSELQFWPGSFARHFHFPHAIGPGVVVNLHSPPFGATFGHLFTEVMPASLITELLMRIELTTSSLPRKCSTPELQQLFLFTVAGCWLTAIRSKRITGNFQRTTYPLSGRRGSNPRPAAWKAAALPTELLPLLICRLNDCLSPE